MPRFIPLVLAPLVLACTESHLAAPFEPVSSVSEVSKREFNYQQLVDWFGTHEVQAEQMLADRVKQRGVKFINSDDVIILRTDVVHAEVEFPFAERVYSESGIELHIFGRGYVDVTYLLREDGAAQPPVRRACSVIINFGGTAWVNPPQSLDENSKAYHKPIQMRYKLNRRVLSLEDIEGYGNDCG